MTGKETRHISADEMRRYARGTLGVADRERVDAELLACETCLELFISVLAELSDAGASEPLDVLLPEIPDIAAMEERVVADLSQFAARKPFGDIEAEGEASAVPAGPDQTARRRSAGRMSLIQRPVVQYTIAASITLLLLASGALAEFTRGLEKLDESHAAMPAQTEIDMAWKNQPSWSDQLVDRTGNWLDSIQASRFK